MCSTTVPQAPRSNITSSPDAWLTSQSCTDQLSGISGLGQGEFNWAVPSRQSSFTGSCWSLLWCGSCSGAVLSPYVSWSCHGSQQSRLPAGTKARAHAWWVQYFLPECPNKVSECAAETVPVLGCRENLNSPSPAALGLLGSPPTARCESLFQSSGSAF